LRSNSGETVELGLRFTAAAQSTQGLNARRATLLRQHASWKFALVLVNRSESVRSAPGVKLARSASQDGNLLG
jgi:hypothetical protein